MSRTKVAVALCCLLAVCGGDDESTPSGGAGGSVAGSGGSGGGHGGSGAGASGVTHLVQGSDCSDVAAIQATIDAAASGDRIHLDCDDTTVWDDTLRFPHSSEAADKSLEMYGNGVGTTVISGVGSPKIVISSHATNTNLIHVHDLELRNADAYGIVAYQPTDGGDKSVRRYRISHIRFDMHGGLYLKGNAYGLVDHCTFHDDSSAGVEGQYHLWIDGCQGRYPANPRDCWASGADGEDYDDVGFWEMKEWEEEGFAFGTEFFHVLEDCTFEYDSFPATNNAMDGNWGGKHVIRHSTLTNMGWGTHGVEIDYKRGKNAFELYGNTFIATEASFTFCADRGSGAGLIYDNQFQGVSGWQSDRVCHLQPSCIRSSSSVAPWGQCDSAPERVCVMSLWTCDDTADCDDANPHDTCEQVDEQADPSGWPCFNMWGAVGSKPPYTIVPFMAWNNRQCFTGVGCSAQDDSPITTNCGADYKKDERNFIEYLAGVGVGTCEDQLDNDGDGQADDGDSTCATWWDPTTHRMRGYTPLAYPHPLR